MQDALDLFLNDVVKQDKSFEYYENILYIFICEFHWTQEQFYSTDIPFIFEVLDVRHKVNKKQEEESKKNKRR